jgi:hypothetical protein
VGGSGRKMKVTSEDVQYAGEADPFLDNRDRFRRKGGKVEGLNFGKFGFYGG